MDNAILLGSVTGIFLGNLAAAYFWPNKLENEAKTVIAQCEQSLPRDQHCVLVAVPEKK